MPPETETPDTAAVDPLVSTDGLYSYRWETRFGRHTVFLEVRNGVILENLASESSPVKSFVGKPLAEFVTARASQSWRFQGDSLIQVNMAKVPC